MEALASSPMSEEPLTTEMIQVLRQIHAEQKTTNEQLGKIDGRLATVEDEIIHFRRETREELVMVHAGQKDHLTELRGLRGEAGADMVKLRERVETLEAAVFPKPTRPARRAGARR